MASLAASDSSFCSPASSQESGSLKIFSASALPGIVPRIEPRGLADMRGESNISRSGKPFRNIATCGGVEQGSKGRLQCQTAKRLESAPADGWDIYLLSDHVTPV